LNEVGFSGGHKWGSFWLNGKWSSKELYDLQPNVVGLFFQTIPKDMLFALSG